MSANDTGTALGVKPKGECLMTTNAQARPSFSTSEHEGGFPAPGLIRSSAQEARDALAQAGEFLKSVIANRPAVALGAALAAGVLLGWLIKRR
jgi:hypothetical protein